MALSGTESRVIATADGVAVAYAFTFKTLAPGDIDVFVSGSKLIGGYAVTLAANQDATPGGMITFNTPPMSGFEIRIERNLDLTQLSTWGANQPFFSKTIEKTFDRLVMMIQQLARRIVDLESIVIPEPPQYYVRFSSIAEGGNRVTDVTIEATNPTGSYLGSTQLELRISPMSDDPAYVAQAAGVTFVGGGKTLAIGEMVGGSLIIPEVVFALSPGDTDPHAILLSVASIDHPDFLLDTGAPVTLTFA